MPPNSAAAAGSAQGGRREADHERARRRRSPGDGSRHGPRDEHEDDLCPARRAPRHGETAQRGDPRDGLRRVHRPAAISVVPDTATVRVTAPTTFLDELARELGEHRQRQQLRSEPLGDRKGARFVQVRIRGLEGDRHGVVDSRRDAPFLQVALNPLPLGDLYDIEVPHMLDARARRRQRHVGVLEQICVEPGVGAPHAVPVVEPAELDAQHAAGACPGGCCRPSRRAGS